MSSQSLKMPELDPEAPEVLLSIGDACEATGLSARTVRYWQELGLLPGVRRLAGGRRVYDSDALERLRFIRRLKTLGLSLAEIKELNAVYSIAGSTVDMLRHLDGQLGQQLADLDTRIEELIALRSEMSRYRDHIDDRIENRDPSQIEPPETAANHSKKEDPPK